MQLAVEHAIVTMATHSHDPHVTLWGAKVVAHASHNGRKLCYINGTS